MRKTSPRGVGLAAAAVAAATLAAGCGSSSGGSRVSASLLLQRAHQTLDAASAVHFQLSSSNVGKSGTNLVNGQGDIARPDQIQGTFGVSIGGFTANVEVASVGGVFEAKLPFTSQFKAANPASFGLKNPAELLDPNNGLTKLLAVAQDPQFGAEERLDGELLDTVSYDVPGNDVPVLPDDNPSQPVQLKVAINPSSYQLRQVTLVGPLTSASSDSTYIVTLTKYSEHVSITLPSTS